ncbi:uncharacterized protein EI97DRAFT_154395 [Westerdykella ornata]|uniref:Transcription factor Iwr1 domain-containing protein n=1 Tax=Westerdykella ornata TaxID=318751 RepID=A0A6A6JAY4_WESOR|nr:uncharacterized protein EI97DRAFT_154395 [Westerdykella ornata]KAF2273572.1 hypothetical protein EI97DRAFT_154395 [Westerdykella ornata]
MAHSDNYVNGRLRLSAFLRIVQNIPQRRPLRIRRRVPNENSTLTSIAAPALSTEAEQSNEIDKGTGVAESHMVQPATLSDHQAEASPFGILPSAAPPERGSPRPHFDVPVIEQVSTVEVETSAVSRTPRGDLIVYRAQKGNADARLIPSTRRRRLPVNELALVRTTTDDSLFDRSEEMPETPSITDTDPIEDSQTPQSHSAVNPASRADRKHRPLISLSTPSLANKSRWKIDKAKKQTNTPGARLMPSHGSLWGLSADGFIASELDLPTRVQTKRRAPSPDKARASRKAVLIPAPVGTLELRSGALPSPSQLPEQLPPRTELARIDDISSDDDYTIPRPSLEGTWLSSQPRRLRRRTEDIVTAQLSAVTAPTRPSTDSDQEEEADDMDDEAVSTATEILEAGSHESELPDCDEEFGIHPPDEHDDSGFCEDDALFQALRSQTVVSDFWEHYGGDMD